MRPARWFCRYCGGTSKHDRRVCFLKVMHADPVFAKARDERLKAMNADPVFAKAHSERLKAMHADGAGRFVRKNSEDAA